jgi:hypothetical protein
VYPNITDFNKDTFPTSAGYVIYHIPSKQSATPLEFIDNNTLKIKYNNTDFNLIKLNRIIWKLSDEEAIENPEIVNKGYSFQMVVDSVATISVVDDFYAVYQGKSVIIPIANILSNDTDIKSDGVNPLSLIAVSNPTNGSVVLNGSNVTFTNTSGAVGETCTFTYTARNYDGDTATGTVNIYIEAVPPIICNPDTYDLQQGETLLLSKSSLSANDVDGLGQSLTVTDVYNPVGGTVALNGDNISFTSTGVSGFPAQFNYLVSNGTQTQVGDVYLNVTPLPPIEGLVYDNAEAVQNAISSGYTPPSVQDIFNTWARYDGANYYANKNVASGQALDWQLLSNPDRVMMPTNTSAGNGFISPDAFDNYTFEATLTSTSTDDDGIGLIVAFNRDSGTNQVLWLNRTQGGVQPSNGWGFVYGDNGGVSTWVINNVSVGGVNKNSTSGDKLGWNSRQSRIKIQRQGDIIKAWCTNWNDVNNYQVTSELTLDLNSDSRLYQFKGKQPYGYYTHSQPYSTYLNISFKGGLDASKMYDIETNTTWEYIGSTWVNTGVTLQEALGYVREVVNPETGVTYIIKGNEIVVKE